MPLRLAALTVLPLLPLTLTMFPIHELVDRVFALLL